MKREGLISSKKQGKVIRRNAGNNLQAKLSHEQQKTNRQAELFSKGTTAAKLKKKDSVRGSKLGIVAKSSLELEDPG